MDEEAGGERGRWCDGCRTKQPYTGFRGLLCGPCFRAHVARLPTSSLVAAIHLLMRQPPAKDAAYLRRLLALPD